jgi:hypothetical protein
VSRPRSRSCTSPDCQQRCNVVHYSPYAIRSSHFRNPYSVAGALGVRYTPGMTQEAPRGRRAQVPWRVVGQIMVDLPRDPYPFAEHWGGATQRKGARTKERRPGWAKSRKLADVLRELRDDYRASHVEHWPFGPSEAAGAGLVARFAINRSRWSTTKNATELQVQLNPRTGRAEWIAIRSPQGFTPSEVARLPWVNIFTVADALAKTVGPRGRPIPSAVVQMMQTLEARPSRTKSPKIARRPGRAGHPDDHYAKVAQRYLALRARGVTNPTKAIADEWNYSRSTVAGWVHEARRRGHLGAARPGRAG